MDRCNVKICPRSEAMKVRCLLIVLNAFTHDSRVLRAAEALSASGWKVSVFALHENGLPLQQDEQTHEVRRFWLASRSWPRHRVIQLFKYVECLLRMVWAGIQMKPTIVHANDLISLPIGYLVAKVLRARLVYDAHEYWADPSDKTEFPPWLFECGVWLERVLARRADAVLTVSDGIAQEMARAMKIPPPVVVRNMPNAPCSEPTEVRQRVLREALGIDANTPIVLHVGGIGPGRGLETLVLAMQRIDPPAVALLLGDGAPASYCDDLKARVITLGLTNRIYFHPAVPPDEVCIFSAGATIGVATIESVCLSYQLCLPNKLFEYIQAGLPVIVSNLPEMKSVIEKYGVGETVPERDAMALATALNSLLSSPAKLQRYHRMAKVAAGELHWGQERLKLLGVYRQLLQA
jgi:glycosyltransferase involved in cell wall biosynthesis